MSTQRHSIQASRDRQRYEDPTHTRTLAKSYARRLRGAYSNIETVIREWVDEDDGLDLTAGAHQLVAEPPHPDASNFDFSTDPQKARAFEQWLRDAQDSELLEVVDIDDNRFVRKAYESGIKSVHDDARDAGMGLETDDLSSLGNQPIHSDSLERLYSRNYELLVTLTDDVADEVREVMTEGFAEGVGPRVMGRRIRDRTDKVGKHRATMIARSETINAHNEAFLTRAEQLAGAEADVVVEAEVMSAEDDRVCDICEGHHGERMTIEEAKSGAGPLYHPQCRCSYRTRFET